MMGLDDLGALRILRDLYEGRKLTFTIGVSVRKDMAGMIRLEIHEMS